MDFVGGQCAPVGIDAAAGRARCGFPLSLVPSADRRRGGACPSLSNRRVRPQSATRPACLSQTSRSAGPRAGRNGLAYHAMGSGNVPHPNRKRGSRRLGARRPTPWCDRTVCPGSGGGWGDRTPIARRRCPAPPPRSRRIEQIAAEHRQPRHRLRVSGKYLPQSVCRSAAAGAPRQLLCSDKLRRVDAAARTVDSDRWSRGRIGARRRSLGASLRLAEPKYGRDRIAGRRIRRNYAVRYIRPLSGYKGAGNSPGRSRAAGRYHGSDRWRRR